jgi:hypothetical protein
MAIPIIAIIGFFTTMITLIVFYYRDKRSGLETVTEEDILRKKKIKQINSLKHGLFLVLGSVGFILGIFIESLFGFADSIIAIPMTFVGAGMGLILFYFMSIGYLKEEDKDDLV